MGGWRACGLLVVLAAALALAACEGPEGRGGPTLVRAGDATVDVSGHDFDANVTRTTIPVAEAEQSATASMGSAFVKFRECLEREGWGDEPLPSGPNDLEGVDPEYLKALGKCNTQTGLVETLQEFQRETENLDPEQIEERNQQIILFRECVIRRGWEWGELVPNENGLLGPRGAPVAPANRDSDRDFEECGRYVQEQMAAAGDGGSDADAGGES